MLEGRDFAKTQGGVGKTHNVLRYCAIKSR